MANQVTLTFAGDATGAKKAFEDVSTSAKSMGDDVRTSGEAFDAAAEKSDTLDTRAMGFRDTLTGLSDSVSGIKRAASGDWGFETLLMLGAGVGDLASGFTNFLIPSVKAMRTAQLGLNLAFLSSPLTWIVIGVVALVTAFVLLWNKSAAFRDFWISTWKVIKDSAAAAWTWIKSAGSGTVEWLKGIPGMLKTAFSGIVTIITWPYRQAFNLIATAWNATIGSLSWTVPSWIPGIGGKSISVPKLPHFHAGGTVPGAPGTYVPILAMAGESVSATGGGGAAIRIGSDGSRLGDLLLEVLATAVRQAGGQPSALGLKSA